MYAQPFLLCYLFWWLVDSVEGACSFQPLVQGTGLGEHRCLLPHSSSAVPIPLAPCLSAAEKVNSVKCSGAFAVSINRGQGKTFPFIFVQWFELPFSKCWSHAINPLQPWSEEKVSQWGHKCFRGGIQGGKLNNGNVNRPFITHPIHHYLISCFCLLFSSVFSPPDQ